MKEYQPRTTKYILPGTLYMQTINIIRDYYRMKDEADSILKESPPPADGQPRGSCSGKSVVERKAIRREQHLERIKIIDAAKDRIPEDYQNGVWDNIMFSNPFPCDAHRVTYGRYKSKFVYDIARDLFFLD